MLYKNEDSFKKEFSAASLDKLYLLFGSESYLIDNWAKKIIKSVCGGDSAFNFQKLDGKKPDPDQIFDATEALPFGVERKCVLLNDLDPSKLDAVSLGKMEELLSDVNPACVLVITARPPLFDTKSANGKKIIKLCEKYGSAVELGARGASGLTAFVKSRVKKSGCEISPEVCRYILQICDNDMNALSCEIAKICAYAGGGEIARSHVDAVATPKVEARVFDLSKAILAGNSGRAMDILSTLFYLRESPVAILATLQMSFVDLYRARVARDEGKTPADVIKMFAYKSEFRVNNAFSGKLSKRALRQCLLSLYDCDLKMKSTGVDDKILLEKAVTELFCARG